MCEQAVPRFSMSIRESYSNTNSMPMTNESDKESVMQISTVLIHVYNLACRDNL